jgi:hypothetical protein
VSIKDDPCHAKDKLGLFVLGGFALLILLLIVGGIFVLQAKAIKAGAGDKVLPDGAAALLGSVVTGVIAFAGRIIDAIKTSWEEVTRSDTNKQLIANSQTPNEVKVVNKSDDPVPVEPGAAP